MRPGYLAGYRSLTPKFLGLGGDKSDFTPAPPPPPGSGPQLQKISHAYDKSTGDFYKQDRSCKEGEKHLKCSQVSVKVPTAGGPGECKFDACCDPLVAQNFWGHIVCQANPESCDHPDTPVAECEDDPNYVEFPEGNWTQCSQVIAAFKAKGIPEKFARFVCDEEDIGAKPTAVKPTAAKPTAAKPVPLPPCPCKLPRKNGKCPPPPTKCGPPPQHQKCQVKGWGPANPICKCGQWRCPNIKDLMMARASKPKPKPKPKPIAKPKPVAKPKPKPMAGLGEATANVIPKVLVAALLLGPVFYILGRKFIS